MSNIALKDLFPNIKDVDELQKHAISMPKYSDEYLERSHAFLDAVNRDDKIICPPRVDGTPCTDIETMISTQNTMIFNMVQSGLKPLARDDMQQNQSLNDTQREGTVLSRGTIMADIDNVDASTSSVASLNKRLSSTPGPMPGPKPEPEPKPSPEPSK